jgi:hypothetical protein
MLSKTMGTSLVDTEICVVVKLNEPAKIDGYLEGFSMVSLETISAISPVVTTPVCYFRQDEAGEAGWRISPKVSDKSEVLKCSLSEICHDLLSRGERGREIMSKYLRAEAVRQMADALNRIPRRPRPTSMEMVD